MTTKQEIIKEAFRAGIRKGFAGFVWMIKILTPVSLFTAVLEWTGWIGKLDFVLRPLTELLGMPSIAVLPLISGILTGVYGAIASMAVLPLTTEQMTLIAIFVLIAHNMIQEGIIQGQSGIHPLKATLFRFATAIVTVAACALFLDTQGAAPLAGELYNRAPEPFLVMLEAWLSSMAWLSVKIFCIIMTILISLEVLKSLGWIEHIVRLFYPILYILGLDRKVGVLWITAVVFGLSYGAAVIVEEARRGDITKEDLEILHLSIGINHSMVEDPTLFLVLGVPPLWLWMPRLIVAIIAVRLLKLWQGHRNSDE